MSSKQGEVETVATDEPQKKIIHSSGVDDDDSQQYLVVMDIEDRYSIWPEGKKIPRYWRAEGRTGIKKECLDYIQDVWTDMRPRTLKKQMEKYKEELQKNQPSEEKLKKLAEEREMAMKEGIDHFHKPQPPNEFCKKLMKKQPVEIIRYRDRATGAPDTKKLSAAVNRGYVLVKFPWTQGGTELGASLDFSGDGKPDPGSFQYTEDGKLTIRGRLKLDYTPVALNATIELKTFQGEGFLEVIPHWKSPSDIRNEERIRKWKEDQAAKEQTGGNQE